MLNPHQPQIKSVRERHIGAALRKFTLCDTCGEEPHLIGPSPEVIMAAACRAFDVGQMALTSHHRNAALIEARAFVVWCLRSLGRPMSYPKIGAVLGGRDHTTIMNLHTKAILLRMQDADFAAACRGIAERFYAMREHSNAAS